MRPGCYTDRKHHTHCSLTSRIGYSQVPIAGNHRLSLLVHHSSRHHHSLGSIKQLKLLSCWVESTHPFSARVVDSRPSVLLHPSGGHNCLTRCRLQMFLKPQVCVEYGNQTLEHQPGHQSSYWLWASVLNFSDLRKTVVSTPPHKKTSTVQYTAVQYNKCTDI